MSLSQRISALLGLALFLLLAAGCSSPRPAPVPASARDSALARLNGTARAAYDRGALPVAIGVYRQALNLAYTLDDPAAIGNAAYNLAACQIDSGQYEPAGILLSEAQAELARAGIDLADVLVLRAKLAYWQDRREEALQFAAEVRDHALSRPTSAHLAEVALLHGSVACDNGEISAAQTALEQARSEARASPHPRLQAGCERLSGRLHLLRDQPDRAAQSFDREAVLHQQAQRPNDLVAALTCAGHAWRQAGHPATASDRLFRAARSGWALGGSGQALATVELAIELAVTARDRTGEQRARTLQSSILSSRSNPEAH